jgi:DNA-binding beta-propeller fold protein YncE
MINLLTSPLNLIGRITLSQALRLIGILLLTLALSLVSSPAARPAARIECVAGCGQAPLGGPAKTAQLIEPFGVAFDQQGNWYICEHKGQRITKVNKQGIITLLAGGESNALSAEGTTASQLKFHDPHGLIISKDQQLYVADTLNHRVVKIDLKTGKAATLAGTGQAGYSGDGGAAIKATFNQLFAVDLNRAGDKLYLTDLRNQRIRLLDLKSGIVTTIAGNGQRGIPTDGADAVSSPLVDPRAAVVDAKGNVYILERNGNALRVVDTKGKIRTLIGPGSNRSPSLPASEKPPDLKGPKHLCVDRNDNVLIVDTENHLIRKYNPKDGTTVVILGSGEKGDRLFADDPLKTQLNRPHGVLVHPSGALYISDSDNHRVLKLTNW